MKRKIIMVILGIICLAYACLTMITVSLQFGNAFFLTLGTMLISEDLIHEKLGNYRLFKRQPSPSEIRRTVTLLKKYQLIEPLDLLEELNESTRLLIYPCIHAVLQGDAVREVLESFGNSREEEEETLGDIG